jgi:adenosylcobinamide-phosphate synthase
LVPSYTLGVVLAAMLLDAVIGDPPALWRRLPHPVVLFGRLIVALEQALNQGSMRRVKGVTAMVVVVLIAGLIGGAISSALMPFSWGWIVEALVMSILIAQKSLIQHVRAVSAPLARHDLSGARNALARIVGRDVSVLDEAGVARAGIETLAENASDGVVAPIFWGALFGLPGIMIYKAVNTADSMIGHRDERYAAFGWAAARLDDLLNLLPARLTGLLICAAALVTPGASTTEALRIMLRDARKHVSPNAGFPESSAAGALGLRLGGPRIYDGQRDDAPWMGDGRAAATAGDMECAVKLIPASFVLAGLSILILWLLTPR